MVNLSSPELQNVSSNNIEIYSRHEPIVGTFTEKMDNLSEESNMVEQSDKVKVDLDTLQDEECVHQPQAIPELYQQNVETESFDQTHNGKTVSEIQTGLPPYQPNNESNLNGMDTEESELFYLLKVNYQNDSQFFNLFDQLRIMFIERQLLDCTLVCEDQCIRAHKLVLAAASPYFRSIFNSFGNFGCNNTAIVVQNVPACDMKLIVQIIYSIDSEPIKLNLNRAISLRKSVHRLKIDFINEKLNQSGIPQLNEELILSLNREANSENSQIHSRKRKRSYLDQSKVLDSSMDSLVNVLSEKQTLQSGSESTDENSSECSSSMKQLKYKHRYTLSNGHLAKCGNDALQECEMEEREEELQIEEEPDCDEVNEIENLSVMKSNSTGQVEIKSNDFLAKSSAISEDLKKSTHHSTSRIVPYSNQTIALEDKEIDLSMNKHNNQEEMLKLVNSAMNSNNVNNDKVANLYKAMKSEIKKLWTNNGDLNCNDSLNQMNNQFLNKSAQNNLANEIISQFYMAGANLNPETARALLFTNELLKNNVVNNNQLQHSINKHSADNSLNTSTSSTNSSIGNAQQANQNSTTAALVAAAQQQILNASFLNKTSNSSSGIKQNSMNGVSMNSSKPNRSLSSNSYNTQNSASSSSSSINSSNGAPVKRGRGRPPRHTQPTNGLDSSPVNGDQILSNKPTPAQSKTLKQYSTSPSLNNITNLNNFNESTATSIADALNAFNQEKKWRPNLENLLALKMRKNKLSSSSTGTASPTNDIGNGPNLMQHSQSNLLTNGALSKNSTPNNITSGNYVQNGSSSVNITNANSSSACSVNGPSTASGNSTSNQNVSNDGKNCCPVCTNLSPLTFDCIFEFLILCSSFFGSVLSTDLLQ